MGRFRLRYRSTDLDLSLGDFVIGRSSRSNLALSDALVSRKHATIRVGLDEVAIEDHGSRNGVVVNGLPIAGTLPLSHMDRVFIGAQELMLIDAEQITDRMGGEKYVVCDACGAISAASKRHCGDCGHRLDSATGTTSPEWNSVSSEDATWAEDTRPVRKLEVIGGIAAKAIKLGRMDEAERVLRPHLDELLDRATGRRLLVDSPTEDSATLFETATSFALSLAHGPRGASWIDWVLRFHTASERIMSEDTIDTLHELVRKQSYDQSGYLRAYLQVVGKHSIHCTSAERFRLGRIQGLARVVEAHRGSIGV